MRLLSQRNQANSNQVHEQNENNPGVVQAERQGRGKQKYVSEVGYAAYHMHDRLPPDSSYIIHGKRLFQEWIVDQFVKVETRQLLWVKQNQNTLRADLYSGLRDAMTAGDNNLQELGRRMILPSSRIGSPLFFRQLYQDTMVIVQARGRPDYFLTITCDPNWQEITEALKPGEVANDRPDILSRVFWMKLNFLLELLLKQQIFGKVIGHIHVIEFQKRGLPHAHILLIVREEDKPRTTEDYDKVVSAEIPDPITHPRLYEVITRTMMHGPCGQARPNAPCMRNGCCRFGFPKQFCDYLTNLMKRRSPPQLQAKVLHSPKKGRSRLAVARKEVNKKGRKRMTPPRKRKTLREQGVFPMWQNGSWHEEMYRPSQEGIR